MFPSLISTLVWLVLLTAIFAHPVLTDSPTLGSDLIRNTIRRAPCLGGDCQGQTAAGATAQA